MNGLVLFGGADASGPANTISRRTNSGWKDLDVFDPDVRRTLVVRVGRAAASDPLAARMITWGSDQVEPSPDPDPRRWTSALSASGWTSLPPPPFQASANASLVYDPVDRVHVWFGGKGNSVTADTYTFDGATWVQHGPQEPPEPAARWKHAAAWLGDRMVMFGGAQPGRTRLGDLWTWTWSGGWTQVSAAAVWPEARSGQVMALDPARQRIVMFGGAKTETEVLDDTWEWDGAAWEERTFATRPPPRQGAAMAWDPTSARLLLFGGESTNGVLYDDTWAYDGQAWRLLDLGSGPSPRAEHVLVPSPDGRGVVLYGGNDAVGESLELWRLRWESGAGDETCSGYDDGDGDGATGCDDADCWAVCAPLCPPATSCAADAPRCGDGTCSAIESCRTCPADCGACPSACGDLVCDAGEVCPGDCP